ncbi:MFS transporter small subunit [Lentzea sp. CA-135723]
MSSQQRLLLIGAWLWVGLPLAYGLYRLFLNAAKLFV